MSNSINLSQIVFDTDYEALDYHQLVEIDLAFTWANGIVKSLLPVKKQEEIKALTGNYLAKHSTARTEPSAFPAEPEESVTEDALNSTNTKNEAVQETPAIASVKKRKSMLEHPKSVETCPDLVKRAIEISRTMPIADEIKADSPYYMCYMLKESKGELVLFEKPYGWNAPAKVLELLKSDEPSYARDHYKTQKTYCVSDYVVSVLVGNKCRVCYYKTDGVEIEQEYDISSLPDDVRAAYEVSLWFRDYKENDEAPSADLPTEETTASEESEWVDNAVTFDTKPSVPKTKKGKGPRRIAIVGTKNGETRRWNSFKECELNLGVGHGVVSQYFIRGLKTLKGWVLKKVEESEESEE